MSIGLLLVIALFGGVIYLLPTIVAVERGHHQVGMVTVLNMCLGWTIVGWAVALSIACSAKRPADATPPVAAGTASAILDDTRTCPHCAETIKKAARICRFCNREVEAAPTS